MVHHAMQEELERAASEADWNSPLVGKAHVDLEGNFLRVNKRFCEISGWTETELLKRNFQSITHPDDVEADVGDFEKAMQRGEGYGMHKRYFTRSNNIAHIYGYATPIMLENEEGEYETVMVLSQILEKKNPLVVSVPEQIKVDDDRKVFFSKRQIVFFKTALPWILAIAASVGAAAAGFTKFMGG